MTAVECVTCDEASRTGSEMYFNAGWTAAIFDERAMTGVKYTATRRTTATAARGGRCVSAQYHQRQQQRQLERSV